MAQNIINPKLLELVKAHLQAGWISVETDLAGDFKAYTVPLANPNENMTITCEVVASNNNFATYEYAIMVNEKLVAETLIYSNQKTFSDNDKVFLDLMSLCAHQVIKQELRTLMNHHKIKPNTH